MRELCCLLVFLLLSSAWGAPPATETFTPRMIEQQKQDGNELAKRLRSAAPEENSEIRGTFFVKARGMPERQIPVVCQVVLGENAWRTIYRTSATAEQPAEVLIVIHHVDGPNEYLLGRGGSGTTVPETKPVSGQQVYRAFAQTDFTLADLGLEFLHWPEQRQFPGELSLGQPCYVLESRNPVGEEIVRIKSFIHKESNGVLTAQAYNAQSRQVKEFSLGGGSFAKVNGEWRVESMKMSDYKKRSQTILKFDLNSR